MNKQSITILILFVFLFIVAGMLFLKPPPPAIIIAPEVIFHTSFLDITNTMFTSWIVLTLMIVSSFFIGRKFSMVPSGFVGGIEFVIGTFYDLIVSITGEENAKKFFWVVSTIFFWIILNNYFALLPGNFHIGITEPGHGDPQAVFQQTSILGIDTAFIPIGGESVDGQNVVKPLEQGGDFSGLLAPFFRSVNTDINTPLAIAIFSFIFVEFWGLSALGFGYLKKFFSFGKLLRGNPMGIIDVFVGLLELVSELSRMVSFTFRLFGNIFAGEVLLIMMGFLVPLLVINIFYGLELFVGFIQAFVFAMLTLVFAQTAVSHHDDADH
ncbi:MAG: F0F1 ATP synthase subunit A [Dehalococcoidia bacterium]|nr:F0F1 ATP synthase subunit A [Dehalococcoidia bacterium]